MMLRRAFALVAAGSVAFVSACAGGDSRETVVVTSVKWVDPDPDAGQDLPEPDVEGSGGDKGSSSSDWQSEYAEVLDDPGAQNFDVPLVTDIDVEFTPEGNYNYALVEANGRGNPELLLSQWSNDAYSNRFARVLVFTTDGGSLEVADQSLTYGAAGAGGFRAGLNASQLGRGFYQTTHSSGTGEGKSTWVEMTGASLNAPYEETDFHAQGLPPLQLVINWQTLEDRAPLEQGELTVSLDDDAIDRIAGGDIVVEGEVVKKTGAELRPEGMPNGEDPSSEYFLLQLDSPQEFTDYRHGGSEYTKSTQYVSLGAREVGARGHMRSNNLEWENFVGERARLTVAPQHVHFQTDTGMPTGALRVGRYENVELL